MTVINPRRGEPGGPGIEGPAGPKGPYPFDRAIVAANGVVEFKTPGIEKVEVSGGSLLVWMTAGTGRWAYGVTVLKNAANYLVRGTSLGAATKFLSITFNTKAAVKAQPPFVVEIMKLV